MRADSTPEVSSPYTLTLLSVLTISDDVGQATLDPQASQVETNCTLAYANTDICSSN